MTTALYWSGGKDCTLALLESLRTGTKVDYLITFVGENTEFLCHPISIMKEQARQLNIPHVLHVIREPFEASYEEAIHLHKCKLGVDVVITGDLICHQTKRFTNYWLRKLCEKLGVRLSCPMGSFSREEVLEKVLEYGLGVYITGVHTGILPIDFLWHRMDAGKIKHLLALHKEQDHDFDLCGEDGEYHTTVLSSLYFTIPIPDLGAFAERCLQVAYLPLLQSCNV